jgi:predicted negative regulator of RcsB-dependent stress response
MRGPSSETRKRFWQKASLWIVFAAVVLGIVGIGWGVQNAHETKVYAQQTKALTQQVKTLTQELTVTGNNHHKETSNQNKAIEQALSIHSGEIQAIADLEKGDHAVIAGLPAADAVLYAEVAYLNQCVYHLSLGTGTACPAPPDLTP